MLSIAAVIGAVLIWRLILLILDPIAKENRSHRRKKSESSLEVAAGIENAGNHVRDAAVGARILRKQSVKIWIKPGIVLIGGSLAIIENTQLPWVAFIGAVLLGTDGVFDEFLMPMLGYQQFAVDRERGEWKWLALGLGAKIVAVWLALCILWLGVIQTQLGSWGIGPSLALVGVAGLLISHLPAVWCARRARKVHRVGFASSTDENTILFLRSFSDDDLKIHTMLAANGLTSPPLPMTITRFEEMLTTFLNVSGNLVAIGRPGEPLPELGAARTYWPDEQWQDAVKLTANRARAIVIIAGETEGLAWEFERLRAWGVLGKVLVILPPDKNHERSQERYRRAVNLLVDNCEYPIDPAIWTGLSVTTDGKVVHRISDSRDWASYSSTIVGFFHELDGRIVAPERGSYARMWDHADTVVDEASSIYGATELMNKTMTQFKTADFPVQQSGRRESFLVKQAERIPVSLGLRFTKLLNGVTDAIEKSNLNDAEPLLREIVQLVSGRETPSIEALLATAWAEVLIKLERFDEAKKVLFHARSVAQQGTKRVAWFGENHTPLSIELGVLEQWISLTEIQGSLPELVAIWEEYIGVAEKKGNPDILADAHVSLGKTLREREQWETALPQLQKATDIAVSIGKIDIELQSRWLTHDCYRARHQFKPAVQEMEKCVTLSDQLGEIVRGIISRMLAAWLLRKLGHFDSAFNYYQQTAEMISKHASLAGMDYRRKVLVSELSEIIQEGYTPATDLRDKTIRKANLRQRTNRVGHAGQHPEATPTLVLPETGAPRKQLHAYL
ncbi:MAG: hypothetical protein GX483_04140 [Actinomycetaceae bacterium]|nr:hypothetical protein [Actinomycetaceae bacterium]